MEKVCVFNKMLEKLMRERELSQVKLSRELNIPPMTISQWLCSSKNVSERAVVKNHAHIKSLLTYFGCSYDYLFFGEGLKSGELNSMVDEVIREKKALEFKLAMSEIERKELERKLQLVKDGQLTMFEQGINNEILAKDS